VCADNVEANAGSGGAVFKTDEDTGAGAHVPVTKIELGGENTFEGYISSSLPMPSAGGFQSTNNTTTTPLGSGATYTGTSEQNNHADVMCSCYSDTAGTLYFDFSVNGSDWRTFPPAGFDVAAGIHEFHTAVKGPRHFRVRFVNSASVQSTFQLYTYFGHFRQGNAPINFSIADDADATIVKSVISGIGNTTATVTDHKALQVTPPPEAKSAFGEALVAQMEPIVQLLFSYNINPLQIDVRDNGGTASIENSMLKLSTGAAANQSCSAASRDIARYQPGIGYRARFTGLFTTGVANSTQVIGVGGSGEGLFFGYNGTDFGLMRRNSGNPEIRTLTVSTASSTAEDITITLDGDAEATVTVTNSGDTTTTANEIASHDYSGTGSGWTAKAMGSTVVFTSWASGSKTGTYSLSSATTAVGTFAQTLAGVSATDTWVAQSSWNGDDIFDGNGVTGVTLDPTKGNVFQIDFQFLGFGLIRFFIEDPDDGEMHLVHSIEYANANTVPSLDNPSLNLYACAENASNTSDIVLKSASMGIFVDGKRRDYGVNRGAENAANLSTANDTPVLSIRVNEVYASKLNRSQVKLNYVSAAVDHTKPVVFKFYANPELTGASFAAIDSSTSSVYKDTAATSLTGGVFLFALPLGKTSNEIIDLKDQINLWRFGPGDVLTISADPVSATGADVDVAINFTEVV
jgi:hypothetical protein